MGKIAVAIRWPWFVENRFQTGFTCVLSLRCNSCICHSKRAYIFGLGLVHKNELINIFVRFYRGIIVLSIANHKIGLNSILFQIITKIFSINYDEKIRWMVNFILEIYKQNIPSKNPKRIEVLHFYSMFTEFRIGICLYALSVLGYFANPVYAYYYEGKIETVLPLYIPTIDPSGLYYTFGISSYFIDIRIFGDFMCRFSFHNDYYQFTDSCWSHAGWCGCIKWKIIG